MEDENGYALNVEKTPGLAGSRNEIMWAFGESLETLAPDIQLYFNTNVLSIDCSKTEIVTEGENAGTYNFDLIVGADGVGSVVRKAMVDQLGITAVRKNTNDHCYTFYMDKHEAVSKLNPNRFYIYDLTKHATIIQTLKFANNQEGIGIINMNQDIKDMAHLKKILKAINPILLDSMSEKSLNNLLNFKKKNVGKSCKVSQYYHGDNFVLIGDAAHPFRPIGQGFNIAMIDGVWLDQAISTFPHNIAKAL